LIVLDTHVMIFDALSPSKLSSRARAAIQSGFSDDELACADISLWEAAMLVARGRIEPGMSADDFLNDMIVARRIRTLPITPGIAVLAQSDEFRHGDPADRLIAATSQVHGAALVTSDAKLRGLARLTTIW
jgi:PIN domain nuclease of toxin-antitoxin system